MQTLGINMSIEIINTVISITGILLGTFVAYHVYSLSKQQTFRERFIRREAIQKIVDELVYKVRNGINSKVEIINIKKYDTHYPTSNTENRHGYTYLGAEIKGYHFAGVEFFCELISAYRISDNSFSRKPQGDKNVSENILVTGVIPYEWIESIDQQGDDTSYRPQFYTHFNGKGKSPYKSFRYYIKHPDRSNDFIEVIFKPE